jgi:type II secretory pathway pseudopilin PulG
VLAAIAAPQFLVALDRQRAWAAARYLAARMAMARSYAVTRSAYVALRFIGERSDVTFQMFLDDNHNGVRSVDIASNVDRAIGMPSRLSELFPGVVIGISTDVGTDAVRIGPTNLMSFSPLGTATPGTIYVRGRDGLQLAVRVTGATGRTRVLRYAPRTRQWVDSF